MAEVAYPPLRLQLPFAGRWMARNSPADSVPSHGTHALGSGYAIDFVRIDRRGRSGPQDWRTWVATEPPERFFGFGAPLVAPTAGVVVIAEDGEPDHVARRSIVAGVPYLLGQAKRMRRGTRAVAGNHVVIAVTPTGPFVLLAHLRRGSVAVRPGTVVAAGAPLAECGNSGNSTQPHVHVQASDSTHWETATGVPITFVRHGDAWLPRGGEVFEADSTA
ncbi:M23 family metallopeptidase [Microbacterium sp. SLBN-146]|uniref:M23 family metallopeptidase n=1 Tax=Microbacterium sp. SLBN-146 TaxID=2768457 RepID=UPI0011513B74|nr:M23 family metallopeptidase [Microbacterium sp. SLBN-146]TQJ31258.1 peptidase M23-like protein [Microbacterium sp. SLBN-146]